MGLDSEKLRTVIQKTVPITTVGEVETQYPLILKSQLELSQKV